MNSAALGRSESLVDGAGIRNTGSSSLRQQKSLTAPERIGGCPHGSLALVQVLRVRCGQVELILVSWDRDHWNGSHEV